MGKPIDSPLSERSLLSLFKEVHPRKLSNGVVALPWQQALAAFLTGNPRLA
jgi:hypothetical protein